MVRGPSNHGEVRRAAGKPSTAEQLWRKYGDENKGRYHETPVRYTIPGTRNLDCTGSHHDTSEHFTEVSRPKRKSVPITDIDTGTYLDRQKKYEPVEQESKWLLDTSCYNSELFHIDISLQLTRKSYRWEWESTRYYHIPSEGHTIEPHSAVLSFRTINSNTSKASSNARSTWKSKKLVKP
ncbi:hypothetical protein BJ508DRAFT_315683 [Ascobolus immersus RN42]|uniref:Uncharacterized protein n=1 Tax=Ascobolus immersus RN42 TaxID=1160509 RepID=A0A3N4HH17_ASCIM|nr:hypothetical protein BJ508DRAFT_315683 [Ascobolus immersus RN42]